ncbi:MAG: hypothetical protein ABJC09_06905 [Terriglobia bacterium]
MAGNSMKTRLAPRHALAGLQAGIFGALLMLAWLMLTSKWKSGSAWLMPNLFATTFYGSGVYRNQLLRASWSGVALMLSIYGGAGILWGVLWRDEKRPLMVFYGAATGLLVYYVFFHVIWKALNPLLTLYSPDRQLEFAHVLWGLALTRSPLYSRRIASVQELSADTQDGAEVRSGEVIR